MCKEWYVTHHGQQFGPVSINDLKYEVERGELNPRVDMVWKQGMEDWIPSGDLDGLFEKNVEAEVEEKAKDTISISESKPRESNKKPSLVDGKWLGAKRSTFIFLCYIFPVLWFVGLSYGEELLKAKVPADLLSPITLGLYSIPVLVIFIVLLKRFQNLGMSMAWFLGMIVPILQFWLGYRLFACPEGYAVHRKMDGIGWVLAVLYWLPILIGVGLLIFALVTLTQSGPDDAYREQIQNYIHRFQEFIPAK